MVCQDPNLFGRLQVYRVINPGSDAPSISSAFNIDVPTTYCSDGDPTQLIPFLGNTYAELGVISPIDDRFKMAHVRNKQLFYNSKYYSRS